LSAARSALAASLLAGKSLQDIHAIKTTLKAGPPSDPKLDSNLLQIATAAAAVPAPKTVAVVRSPLAASAASPSGRPDWARGARVTQSYGPFKDAQGVPHYVDLLQFTFSIPFAFGTAATPFGVLPYHGTLIPPTAPSGLALGSGSVWFLASLLSATLPAGEFTGFTITGGKLSCTAPLSLQSGVYVAPATATITITVNLAAPVQAGGSPGAGQDAAGCVFSPPSSVTIAFTQGAATLEAVADSVAQAYGSKVTLHWNKKAASKTATIPSVLIPCDPTPASFVFSTAASVNFAPSGSSTILLAGWSLPLAATSITSLPEAAGPGSGLILFHTGAAVQTAVEAAPVPITEGQLEIGTGSLYVVVSGIAKQVTSRYEMWPQAAPSKLNASFDFVTPKEFTFVFVSTTSEEILMSAGSVTSHFDRPLDATGSRFAFTGAGFLLLAATKSATGLFVLAETTDVKTSTTPLALENALLGVDDPALLIVFASVQGLNVLAAAVGWYFNCRWLLPSLPDPYAANFDLSVIPGEKDQSSLATLLAALVWTGGTAKPVLAFQLLPPPGGTSVTGTPFPATLDTAAPTLAAARGQGGLGPALLDLSTRVDLFGVALFPSLGELLGTQRTTAGSSATGAPALALSGMSLALNGSLAVTFALPQVSWEPMESTAADEPGPIYCTPASDGVPLLLTSPNNQKLVPFSPGPMLVNNIENVASGLPFGAVFSLPFGLNALILQANRLVRGKNGTFSTFIEAGGEFRRNSPSFPETGLANSSPTPLTLTGAFQLTVMPTNPTALDASFPGYTEVDTANGPYLGLAPNGYGYSVIGNSTDPVTPGVGRIFENEFGQSGASPGVPLRRIDFSGYGASIFSEWNKPDQIPPAIIKVQFETTVGRTAYEVIKAASVIYPYCIRAVRTVTMTRQNAGWVKRTDTGWKPASQGQFQFPADPLSNWTNRVHPGALAGVFNVRNIREQAEIQTVPNPANTAQPFLFQKVLFDADLGIAASLKVLQGGFSALVAGITNPPVLVASRDIAGYLQLQPDEHIPDPTAMETLLKQTGPLTPAIACVVEAGAASTLPGTTLRCSAFETTIITQENNGALVPALGVALRGAPQIPRGGGWSLGQRKYTDAAPSALPNDFPAPLVQPAGVSNFWYLSDVTDVLQLTQPNNYYSLMHSTGTHKVLFESPQIPTTATTPGLQFPKPTGAPKTGGVPINAGSPNLGDLASILNSTGLFPDIANAISLITGAVEQINTISQGFDYSKTHTFDANEKVTLIDLGVIKIELQYADTTKPTPQAAALTYAVHSASSPSWSLSIGTLSFLVTVPIFGNSPILTITGGFAADEHTKAGLTNLNVQLGDALSVVKSVFSDLQALAQFLPGGAGANLDVALSDGKLTVSDSFTIGDMPLGLGDLTDISLNLGLSVQLSPLSVDFAIGIGDPGNPFNWIVSPLAGNGLMDFGVRANQPSLTIQAGIGLGLAIDLGIASGSASVTIAVQLNVTGDSITLMAILSGQASVDVLDGLASASITLTAALGFGLSPIVPPISFSPAPPSIPTSVTLGPETITLLASCSVGIHISICWVISISWDGSWQFSQSVTTPQLTVGV
jgi:hypothetical protein